MWLHIHAAPQLMPIFPMQAVLIDCRAALQCVNKCLHRLCSALGGFHLLRPNSKTLSASLQQVTRAISIDGVKIEGVDIGQHV